MLRPNALGNIVLMVLTGVVLEAIRRDYGQWRRLSRDFWKSHEAPVAVIEAVVCKATMT